MTRKNGEKSPILHGTYSFNAKKEFKSDQYYKIDWDSAYDLEIFVETDNINGLYENQYFKLLPNQFIVGIKIHKRTVLSEYTQGLEFKLMELPM